MLSMIFSSLYLLSLNEQNFDKAHLFIDKQQALAKLFEMGKYHEVSCRLDLATAEKDVDTVLDTVEAMLFSLNDINTA